MTEMGVETASVLIAELAIPTVRNSSVEHSAWYEITVHQKGDAFEKGFCRIILLLFSRLTTGTSMCLFQLVYFFWRFIL